MLFNGLKKSILEMLQSFSSQIATVLERTGKSIDDQTRAIGDHGTVVLGMTDELKKTVAALAEQVRLLKQHDGHMEKLMLLLGNLERRMNTYSFSAVECQTLVGELRAVRYLLDERGQYKHLDKPRIPSDIPQ